MDVTVDAEGKARRRDAIDRGLISHVPDHLPEQTFKQDYLERTTFVSHSIMEDMERRLRLCYCRECLLSLPHGRVSVSKVMLTRGEDPLRNFPYIDHLLCHNCGWEELHPADPVKIEAKRRADYEAAKAEMHSHSLGMEGVLARYNHPGSPLTATEINAIRNDQRKMYEDMIRMQDEMTRKAGMMAAPPVVGAIPEYEPEPNMLKRMQNIINRPRRGG